MKAAFIGTGSMGSVLIEAFIQSGALGPEQIVASNRTAAKAKRLAERYPGLLVAAGNAEAAQGCDLVFLCVKPSDYKRVVDEIKAVAQPQQIVVSITSPVMIRHLEAQLPCKVMKMIPSITNYVLGGATLMIFGGRMEPEDKELIENMLSHISTPICVTEEHTRICSDLSSVGPAFLSYFIQRFVEAAVDRTGIPYETAVQLASEMVLGTGKLLTTGGFNPVSLQKRVTVPGGITEAGLELMSKEMDGMFDLLIRATHAKYDEDVEKFEAQFVAAKE
ncbi:competence protein [Gordoniibacillus kamchatkensis]|uniref:Pyrroline-5-carboxylate reductase n=1 Tax=Gordoniibacillus kamchatkensis TaxID=1590651 RepID=A0ABR5AAD7_9BACL|nr:late competence protein ComER [Paenibacillus sp. VKM B-2647]KIL37925.1 competence protein [Paenibacillus sp. VKM B-2647]